ncbi:MAG TPA: phage major capsid protein [Acidocella sp.]|nr:phage major capsid protein [Acidocella sp.]
MKLKEIFRSTAADVSNVDEENRTVDLTFSSEQPVDQYFGREILSHEPGAADLSRLKAGAPLLWNHNKNDVRGVVESAHIGNDKRGHATVRFSKSAKGEEAFQDVKDKIVRGVSVGYRIKDMKQSGGDRNNPEFTINKWQPNEISLAPVPADHTVGVGRADLSDEQDVHVELIHQPETATREENTMNEQTVAAQAVQIDTARSEAASAERQRIAAISAMGDKFNKADLARKLVEEGKSLDVAREQFLEVIGAKQQPIGDVTGAAGYIDASARELKDYSICRAIMASNKNDWSKAGFELECSKTIAQRSGRDGSDGFFLPVNIPMGGERSISGGERATSATAYGATINAGQGGGNLVQTTLLAGSFIEVLRNKARVMSLGARMLSGLVGNIAIPRQDGATQTYWVSPEGADLTEAETTFDQIVMSPKTLGARSQYTRQMLMQSTPDIEMLVRDDLAQVLALAIDLACISGTGAGGQPTGILNKAGIGSVALGANGGPITIDAMIALETTLTAQNVDETNLAYLTNAKQVGSLKTLKDTNGRYLWTQYPGIFGQRTPTPGELNGYPVARSNQVPSNLNKGTGTNLSAVIFANWSDLIVAEWGVLEILPNPYGAGFNSGSIDIRALQSVDINMRHPQSFAVITDAS